MKRTYLQLLLLLALLLPIFTACKKDKEVAPSKKELLMAHPWKGDQVLIMGINISESGAVQGGIPDIRALALTFNSDNTYTAKNEDIKFAGIWRFNEEETKLYFDFLGLGEFNVDELTKDNLNLSTSISKKQLTLLAQLLSVDLGVINRFPDGTQFETELKFVKP